jgi:hypothetical protein
MDTDSVKYTSFVTCFGQFEFLKMPFGLTNAPKVFNRFIYNIFLDLIKHNKVLVYLDDILVATETINEHFDILKEVFRLAARHKLKFRIEKCSFLQNEINYLGYIINFYGITPNPKNVQGVVDFPIPQNHKQIQFLGLQV